MSINAVKGVEIGSGFDLAAIPGEIAGDEMRAADGNVHRFSDNHAGGILGGISSGQEIVVRLAIKPTSSILTTRQSVDLDGKDVDVMTKGRHDPCVGIHDIPVAEAMMACVLLDQLMRHKAQTGCFKSNLIRDDQYRRVVVGLLLKVYQEGNEQSNLQPEIWHETFGRRRPSLKNACQVCMLRMA